MSVRKPSAVARRRAARLAAVQALYNLAQSDQTPEGVLGEFVKYRLGAKVDGDHYVDPDRPLFQAIVNGVTDRAADLDSLMAGALTPPWSVDRLELILSLILRAGAWELMARPETQARIIIADYIELARAFYDGKEPGVVNAVLDRLARVLRPEELGASSGRG